MFQQAINKILERVKNEVERILNETQFKQTEEMIRTLLNHLQTQPLADTSDYYLKACNRLRQLNVEENDLVNANERVMEFLRKLVKTAEKLE